MEDVVEVVEEAAELQSVFEPLVLSLDEYLARVLGLFGATLGAVMDTPPLQFFAAFGLMWVALSLTAYLVRSGRSLAK